MQIMKITPILLSALLLLGTACGGGGSSGPAPSPSPSPNPAQPAADIELLFLGNSHTHHNNVPGLVAALFQQAQPTKTVRSRAADGILFLDERLNDAGTLALFDAGRWTHVVLQAQKYSSSGTVDYSIGEAQEWVRRSRARSAVAVMFPEWPRRGVNETARIYDLHRRIAEPTGACLAPVPQAFDAAARSLPAVNLHAVDGNHSSAEGALLASYVLYASASGASLQGLGPIVASPLSATVQEQLRQVAQQSLAAGPSARAYCTP